eukprot:1205416-Pleurochrysis_carterae.AAC.1
MAKSRVATVAIIAPSSLRSLLHECHQACTPHVAPGSPPLPSRSLPHAPGPEDTVIIASLGHIAHACRSYFVNACAGFPPGLRRAAADAAAAAAHAFGHFEHGHNGKASESNGDSGVGDSGGGEGDSSEGSCGDDDETVDSHVVETEQGGGGGGGGGGSG